MPSLAVLRVLLRELTTSQRSPRVPEPGLVMDDPGQVDAYVRAGREDGVMAPVYLFHCANICEVIRPGDTVLDLACGPANQLAMVARLNPETRFIGLDLSEPMLEQARALVAEQGLGNVSFQHGDISDLAAFPDASIDALMTTMALHHLPDVATLELTLREAGRVLKPDAGIYLVDFGHLKAEHSIHYFAHQYQDRQPALFTLDYLNSLHAAFQLEDLRQAAEPLLDRARLYTTFLMPFMVAIKSPPRRPAEAALSARLGALRKALPKWHHADYSDLSTFFRLGGLRTRLLP